MRSSLVAVRHPCYTPTQVSPISPKRAIQQRLMHQQLTRSRQDAALKVLRHADSMFLLRTARHCRIQIDKIKSACLHVGPSSSGHNA